MLALVLTTAAAGFAPTDSVAAYERYKADFGKSYPAHEEEHRFANFRASLSAIRVGNAERAARGVDETQGLNQHSDLSPEEFRAQLLCTLKHRRPSQPPPPLLPKNACAACERFPEVESVVTSSNYTSFDWTTKGAVTPVKDQAGCGGCWAFSVAADVEGTHFLATGNLTSLSEEQMIGCDPETRGQGCDGGEPSLALDYVVQNGLTSEQSYPFSDGSGPEHTHCASEKIRAPLAHISKWVQVSSYPNTNEEGLAAALAKNGPLSLSIDASAMHHYAGGVDDPVTHGPDATCQDVHVNHAVLLVGYGVDQGKEYWRIKNSWGTAFGEAGYYRVARGSNICGLANDVVHSVV